MDCLPASQSAISVFSAENSKLVRTLASFLRSEGTGESHNRLSVADLCAILSFENRDGALQPISSWFGRAAGHFAPFGKGDPNGRLTIT
jgi:hypothetical protein